MSGDPTHTDSAIAVLIDSAARLRQQGRFAQAAQAYSAVVQAVPEVATTWYNLGFCQRMSGQFEAALTSYQNAIDRGLDASEEAHLNRAVIFSDALRRDADAERELRRALELNPNYLAAILNLANLSEDLGRRPEAIALYERALELDPKCSTALARYANLLPSGPSTSAVVSRLRHAMSDPAISGAHKAELGFSLGRVLDQRGEFDAAFQAYSDANAESRRALGARYDRAAAEALVAHIIEVFSERAPTPEPPRWAPVFICGMFRSGSTLAEQVLAGHGRISPGGEIGVVPALVQETVTPFPERAADLNSTALASLTEEYERRVRRLFPGVDLVTDKWLGNYLYVGLIKRMFPTAKIVHTVRHPLDNVLSVFFLHLDASLGYAVDLMDTAHQLRLSRRLMAHWRDLYPADVIEFDYDAFVAKPRETAQALTEALGLAWDEECLAIQRRTNAVKTASVWQVRQSLYSTSSGRWENYRRPLEEVRSYLADLLESAQSS